jgi:hypothetical protein
LCLLFTAIKFSHCGSSPYISTDKRNKNEYIYINETTKNTVQHNKTSKYMYTYYQNNHTIAETTTHYKTHIHTPTHYKPINTHTTEPYNTS